MSNRTASWLAWSLWALSVALTTLSLVLLALIRSHPGIHVFDWWLGNSLVVIDATVGAEVASRRPENPVGWLLCLSGVATSTSTFTSQYAIYALLAQPNSLPAGEAMAWIAAWTLPIMNGVQVFYLLLFPTGRLPSRRWRWLAWLTVAYILVGVLTAAFSPGAHLGALGPIRNPLGIEGLTQFYKAVLHTMSPALFLAAAFSLVVRLRRAVGVERQQLKWLAYAAGGLAIVSILINLTLVYGSLTAILAGVYFGSVTATQALFSILTDQQELPQLVVVTSTLLIAALFNPLRRRIQSFIDRRFYRSKYDARKTLEAFSVKLREETDLQALNKDLVGVVAETMQPAHVSLWLRADAASRGKGSGGKP